LALFSFQIKIVSAFLIVPLLLYILKLNNLLDEWRNLATIIEDLDMLDKMRNINLVREIVVPESLYLN